MLTLITSIVSEEQKRRLGGTFMRVRNSWYGAEPQAARSDAVVLGDGEVPGPGRWFVLLRTDAGGALLTRAPVARP